MYIEKFEADSLDEALKAIKNKLGPDAIILKTITNKGLRGALGKSKIEITAAISEKNYTKKAKVDHVMDEGNREKFYQAPSSYISQMIDNYSGQKEKPQDPGYGKMALNKVATQTKKAIKSGLDDFLGTSHKHEKQVEEPRRVVQERQEAPRAVQQAPISHISEVQAKTIDEQQRKIDELEGKIFKMSKTLERVERKEPQGIFQLRTTLKSLDISEGYIQNLIKKIFSEFDEQEFDNEEPLFDYALQEMSKDIRIELPLFSKMEDEKNAVTVLVSSGGVGQTSTAFKLASLKENSRLIRYNSNNNLFQIASKAFNIKVEETYNLAEVISKCRKANENNENIILDINLSNTEKDEGKQFISGLRRSFDNIEVLLCASAIHSEVFNRNCFKKLGSIADGVIFTHLDQCLNYGSLFNIHESNSNLPLKFFTTGKVIPEDIESATRERILNGLFKFDLK